ncbi:Formamidopyrimidine-DNA glycosylase OS=Streptomyces albaduncus OX=68172 GN=mutM PE=3 SV=1 [Streptomyces griseoloalbus]
MGRPPHGRRDRGAAPACRTPSCGRRRRLRAPPQGTPRRRSEPSRQVPLAAAGGHAPGDPGAPRDERAAPWCSRTGSPDEKHLRIRVRFADALATELRFVDQRTFGGLSLHDTTPDGLPDVIAHIARDPLDPLFDEEAFHQALRRKRTTIKRALLDQSLISGVGNIYADEALWRTRIHYDRPTANFTRPRTAELLGHIRDVMKEALAVGGTSFDSLYVNVNGESGYFDRSLDAYGREGLPCKRCGTPMRRRPG